MTRVFTEGFELGDVLSMNMGNAASLSTNVLAVRSGTYCAYYSSNAGGGHLLTGSAEYYTRAGLYSTDHANYVGWYSGETKLGQLTYNPSTNCWDAYVGGVLVAAGSVTMAANTKFLLELHIKIGNGTDGIIQTKIDGVTDINFSGDTQPGAITTINTFRYVAAVAGTIFVDDLACNDTTGGVDNSWCGDGHIIFMRPNAAGDITQWLPYPSTGTNYAMVDDTPADADTTYVYQTGTNAVDLYNLTSSGLSSVVIYRVWAEARAKDTLASGGEISLLVKTNGVIYTGTNVSLLTTYTKQVLGDVYITNPQTGLVWSISELEALQVGVMVRS